MLVAVLPSLALHASVEAFQQACKVCETANSSRLYLAVSSGDGQICLAAASISSDRGTVLPLLLKCHMHRLEHMCYQHLLSCLCLKSCTGLPTREQMLRYWSAFAKPLRCDGVAHAPSLLKGYCTCCPHESFGTGKLHATAVVLQQLLTNGCLL